MAATEQAETEEAAATADERRSFFCAAAPLPPSAAAASSFTFLQLNITSSFSSSSSSSSASPMSSKSQHPAMASAAAAVPRPVHRSSSNSSLFHSLLLTFPPPNPSSTPRLRHSPPVPRSPPPPSSKSTNHASAAPAASSSSAHRTCSSASSTTLMMPASVVGKKKPPGYVSEEPASPEVTCMGRVRRSKRCNAWDALLGGGNSRNPAARPNSKLESQRLGGGCRNAAAAAAAHRTPPALQLQLDARDIYRSTTTLAAGILIVPRPLQPFESIHDPNHCSKWKKFIGFTTLKDSLFPFPPHLYRKCSTSKNRNHDLALVGRLLRRVSGAPPAHAAAAAKQIPLRRPLVGGAAAENDVIDAASIGDAAKVIMISAQDNDIPWGLGSKMEDLTGRAAMVEGLQVVRSGGSLGTAKLSSSSSTPAHNGNCLPFATTNTKVYHSSDRTLPAPDYK